MAENDTILNCVELYSNKLCQANKRANQNDCDTERRREKDRCSTASVRAQSKSVDKVIQEFLAKVKFGPDYVCTCCHRMLYRHAVIGFKPTKYTYQRLTTAHRHQFSYPALLHSLRTTSQHSRRTSQHSEEPMHKPC